MTLSFQIKLTPGQTRALLALYRGDYTDHEGLVLPNIDAGNWFVPTMKALGRKGLASHDPYRSPSHMITEHGERVAELILRDAEQMLKSKKRKPVKVKHRKATRR